MNRSGDAAHEPEHNDIEIHASPTDAVACAFTPEVKIEFDQISQILEEMKVIQEETTRGMELNRVAILVTALLALIAIVLSFIILLRVM